MITHKFREVLAFADEVTVLRRGRKAGQGMVAGLTAADLADMMMGGGSRRRRRSAANASRPAQNHCRSAV